MSVAESIKIERAPEKPTAKVACREFSLVERPSAGALMVSDASGRGTWQRPELTEVSAAYALLSTDSGAAVTTGSSQITVTLPSATTGTYTIKKVDSGTGTVKVDPGVGVLIDGQTEYILSTQWAFVILRSNGTNWYIVGIG